MSIRKADYIAKYGEEAWEKEAERRHNYAMSRKEKNKAWYEENKEQVLEYHRQYNKEHKEEISEYNKSYRETHKENKLKYDKEWRETHKENIAECNKRYRQTKKGRAQMLYSGYVGSDKLNVRGECALTPEWIIDNIFTSKCIYCGESDWRKLGCDRIDNSKPHTPDNVVCSCWDCNNKRKSQDFETFKNSCRAD